MKISSNRKDSTREDDDNDGHDMIEARSPSNSISSQQDPVQPPPVKDVPKSPGPASATTMSGAATMAALPPQVPSAATTASKPSKSQSSTSAASS